MKAPQTFGEFFSKFQVRVYKKHASIINAGDQLQKIFYLKKGFVRLYSMSAEGKELTLIIYKPGNFFPLFTALNPKTSYPFWVETITKAEVIVVPVDSFVSFFKDNPNLLMNLSMEIMGRLDDALKRMEYFAFGNVYTKIACILTLSAKRYGKKEGNEIVIELPLTHKDIGLLIASARETVSSEIKKFENKGIIEHRGKTLVIKSMKRLEKEALLDDSY